MFSIIDYQINFIETLGYMFNFLFILFIFCFSFIIPGYLFSKSYLNLRDRLSKNEYRRDINFSLIVLFGFLSNLLIFIIVANLGLLNNVWVMWIIYSLLFLLFLLYDFYQSKWKLRKYFLLWKIRLKKVYDFILFKKNWFVIFILLGVLLYIISSFLIPYPPGEDMMGHSLYVQLIYEQNTLFPLLDSKISPIIISTNKIFYPMFPHYIATISYSLIEPITGILSPTFMNSYYKIWLLILPITYRETISKIFNKKVGYVSSIMLFLFAPTMFIIWRWGGFSFTFGLIFLSITILNILNYDRYAKIDYYAICLFSLFITLICHTVVFTFVILFIFAIAIHNINLRLSKKYELVNEKIKKMYHFSIFIIIAFIYLLVLFEAISTLQKNKNYIINNLKFYIILSVICLLLLVYIIINQCIISRKQNIMTKKHLHKFLKSFNLIAIISTITIVFLLILYISKVNEFISNMSLVNTIKFLFKDQSKKPIISFDFIRNDPIFSFKSHIFTLITQVFANIYINGILFIGGLFFLSKKLKELDNNFGKKIFYIFTGVTILLFVVYGLSQISFLSFLEIKFYFAFYLIRYERLFVVFNIIITPAFSAYFLVQLNKILKNQEKILINPSAFGKIKLKYFKRKKVYNSIIVVFISLLTLGTYFYIGIFGTNLYYTNDHKEATQWILDNTDEDDRFIVDRYGSWILFTTGRKISFMFLTGSGEVYKAQEITKAIIKFLEEDTINEIMYLRQKGYCYLYLSEQMPNDIQSIFYSYYGRNFNIEYFEKIPYIDIVYRGEYDMILYLNTSSFTYETYHPPSLVPRSDFVLSNI